MFLYRENPGCIEDVRYIRKGSFIDYSDYNKRRTGKDTGSDNSPLIPFLPGLVDNPHFDDFKEEDPQFDDFKVEVRLNV